MLFAQLNIEHVLRILSLCVCVLPEWHRTCSEQCDVADPKKKSKTVATVSGPFVQPAPAKAGGKPEAKDTPSIGMQKLKLGTTVLATIPGCGTLQAVIKKVHLDKETNIYWYDVEFEDDDVRRLKQGVMNKAGNPAKANEIVPVPPRMN
jgi:hypothetical protein